MSMVGMLGVAHNSSMAQGNEAQSVNASMMGNSRMNQTSMILSTVVPGINGEPDATRQTVVDYTHAAPVRGFNSSELRRISNLGELPQQPDLSALFVKREEAEKLQSDGDNENHERETSSQNSGDSPREEDVPREG